MPRSVVDGPVTSEAREFRRLVEALQDRLDAEVERVEEMIAGLEIIVVSDYLVKVWPDSGVWVAHCPTVRCACEGATRDEAVGNVAESIDDMIAALVELGEQIPARDIAHG